MIQPAFDFLIDLQNAGAQLGRFSGFETNPYTLLGWQLMDTLKVRDVEIVAIKVSPSLPPPTYRVRFRTRLQKT